MGEAEESRISNSYVIGDVTGVIGGSEQVGGLIGLIHGSGAGVFTSYFAGEVDASGFKEGLGTIAGDTPYLSAFSWTTSDAEKMTEILYYTDPDFEKPEEREAAAWDNISADGNDDSVWRIYEGQSAPLLRVFMKKVNVTGQAVTREYDGTTDATISDLKFADADDVDGVTFASTGNGHYADANAGEDKTVTFNINYELADGETNLHTVLQRYDFVEPKLTGTINKKVLTATASATDKTYDGNTAAATGTTLALSGFIPGETITATVTDSTFNSKNVNDANTVTVNSLTLNDGTDGNGATVGKASNYSLANGQTAVAKITAKALTATASATDKTYDGNTAAATGTTLALSGFIPGETITATVTDSTFNSKNVSEPTPSRSTP